MLTRITNSKTDRLLALVIVLLCACQSDSSKDSLSFTVPDQAVVDAYEKELRNNWKQLDNVLLYDNYDHLKAEQNLDGSITISDDGLFYHTKEDLLKNRNVTLDELVKKMNEMSEEELNKLENPEELSYTVDELRSILIKLKNEKIRNGSSAENMWIYLDTESHTQPKDIINVLVMMKSLDIAFKPGHLQFKP